jgi:hypothetical protein
VNGALYRWPAAAAFGRVVPKTKFYEHATISTRVREKFVSEVQRITWAYKMAEETIRLTGDSGVPEIQVFTIDAKGQDISDDVLATIDKAVQTPVIFEINRETSGQPQSRMTAAHKALGGTAPRLTSYFTTSWLPTRTPRVPLPPALDLPGLYAQLLTPLLPIGTRPGESVAAASERVSQTRKIEREIAALEKRIRSEPQFNRKVELRRQLRERTAALAALTDPARPTTEDGPWTS